MTNLDPFESQEDPPSAILAKLLYMVFLIMGVILLVNMMIALLSNTYQQVQVTVSLPLKHSYGLSSTGLTGFNRNEPNVSIKFSQRIVLIVQF